ncbi:MAG: RNA polymerase sigma factor [Sandaracinaceae bacterium]
MDAAPADDDDLVARARGGDRAAFDALATAHLRPLRAVVRRLVGHPEDAEDLVQQALLKAWRALGTFRAEARFGTWLCAIGTRLAIDHLRAARRWRTDAQVIHANRCQADEARAVEILGALAAPDAAYDVHEHIAYCFTCVGRSLPPEQQAAIVLREVLGLDNREAARALGVSRSVLRHRLASGRRAMEARYEGLCRRVRKEGGCYQCAGLRELAPGDRRGPTPPARLSFAERLVAVRQADPAAGPARPLHDLLFRHLAEQEEACAEDPGATVACGPPTPSTERPSTA